MLSENIKLFRQKSGLTQKDLADKLYVTPQAVSRWENGDTEPSITTLGNMASIFNVSIDELLGHEPPAAPEPEVIVKTETVYKEAPIVYGICQKCKKAITSSSDLVEVHHSSGRHSYTTSYLCKNCDRENKKRDYENCVRNGLTQRSRSFIWGGVLTGLILLITLIVCINCNLDAGASVGICLASLLFFPFISCLFLKNNFIGDMVIAVARFGFVRFPALIFSLDLDGIIWLLTVKLLFWIIGFILATLFVGLAIALGLVVSLFVYPFALRKNFVSPEKTEI